MFAVETFLIQGLIRSDLLVVDKGPSVETSSHFIEQKLQNCFDPVLPCVSMLCAGSRLVLCGVRIA